MSYRPLRLASWPESFGSKEPVMRARELKQLLNQTARLTPVSESS